MSWLGRQLIVSRDFIKGHNLSNLLRLTVLDWPLLLQVKLPVVDRIHPQSNTFTLGMEKKMAALGWMERRTTDG